MKFQPGNKMAGKRGNGKLTNLKNEIIAAYNSKELGGTKGLVKWAAQSNKNKRDFYQWLFKMLPNNVTFGEEETNQIIVNISEAFVPKRKGNGGNGKGEEKMKDDNTTDP